ncbi:MAG: hypothetical protein LBH00_09005 [Planctomycetaceae bacterium]|jgi:hypothetical protein|nr:hypothetical protein [Planctomycetaceae bacterium]
MSLQQDAQLLAQWGQRVNQIGADAGTGANRVTAGFPHTCDTPKAKQLYAQAEQLSKLLKQCSELGQQIRNHCGNKNE